MSKTLEVTMDNGEKESVEVKVIKVSQFPFAFVAHDSEDEAKLLEIATGKHPGWPSLVSVDSYNELVGALYEVNASGFFAYAGRRTASRAVKAALAEQFRSQSRGSTTSPTSGRGPG